MFLREPVGRTISTIRHMLRDPLFHPMHHDVKGRSLKDVIYDDALMSKLSDVQTRLLSFDVPIDDVLVHVRLKMASNSFVELAGLEWTSSLAKALRVVESYDVVGLMDRFEDSLRGIADRFGFVPPEIMPGLNKALDAIDPDRDLGEKDIAHIESFLPDDIALYGAVKARLGAALADQRTMLTTLLSKGIVTPVSGPLDLDLGRPFPGSGWYAPERQGEHLVRWSGPATQAMLYLPITRDRRRSLHLGLFKPESVPGVDVYVDGEKANPRVDRDGNVLRLEVDLPEVATGEQPWTTVTVDTLRVSTPSDRGGGDLRTLGVLLFSAAVN